MNQSKHPDYSVWASMKNRCHGRNPHARYGRRGIKVCDRWRESFWNFVADMGPRPSRQHTIERKENDGDYTPDNCKWATRSEQMRNTCRYRGGLGRPFTITFEKPLYVRLQRVSEAMRMSISDVIRLCVSNAFPRLEKEMGAQTR